MTTTGGHSFNNWIFWDGKKGIGVLSPTMNPDCVKCLWRFTFFDGATGAFTVGPTHSADDAKEGVLTVLSNKEGRA